MYRVLGCVFEQHDLRLVVLAGVLCLFACFTAMSMIWRAGAAKTFERRIWIMAAGVVAGCGIWGTHFVAMLAYQAGFPVAYDLGLTILSAVIAMTMCGVGFAIALIGNRAVLGGALTGAAIGTMHYTGMAAVRVPAEAIWNWNYVAVSVVIGVCMMAYGMQYTLRRQSLSAVLIGAVVFTLAICSMHFTGMSAVIYKYNPTISIPGAVVEPATVAIAIASVAVLIVALGLIGAVIDNHLAERSKSEANRLRAHIAELEATKAALEHTSSDLSLALEEAAAAGRAKAAFLATMSHELRTPLNAIIGYSEIMKTELFGTLGNKRYRDYVEDIHHSSGHLLALINDILDISRIDAGDCRLDECALDLRQLIGQAASMVRSQADAAGLALELRLAPDLPEIRGDKRRLEQVLINLLANAVKFTPPPGTISVRAFAASDGVRIVVSDTGIGIAAGDIPRALERFGQVDSRLSRKYEGVGLGLPLAKQFVELHGGNLTLASKVDVGTTVTVTLPASRIIANLPVAAAAFA
jgi:signal transduction histidine kinase